LIIFYAVGYPEWKYLWIFSRMLKIDKRLCQEILGRFSEKRYDVAKFIRQDRSELMRLKEYFEGRSGICILSTADRSGRLLPQFTLPRGF